MSIQDKITTQQVKNFIIKINEIGYNHRPSGGSWSGSCSQERREATPTGRRSRTLQDLLKPSNPIFPTTLAHARSHFLFAIINRPDPVKISFKNTRFLITHNPTNATLNKFTEDWTSDNGAPPPNQIVDDWLKLSKTKFREEPDCCVVVRCVAGLGRVPVLVVLALIEGGMKYEDAVQFIRQKRRGAFNSKQLLFLEKYRPKMRLRFRDTNGHCSVQ
uniref:protein tyrosine phosphatase type IVA 2-like n=1 Tax=Myodes glareolus TaxID=447135 RepID=UPI00201FCC57|nr:protein tyrosine phosphatase type IVA 2-like [Myodes glareolus]